MYTGPDPTTETSDGQYIHSYPKVRYPSDVSNLATNGIVVVQEKLDGGNFRVRLDETTRVYGSKKNLRGSDPDSMNVFFQRPAQYIEDTITPSAQADVYSEYGTLTVFGESMLFHSIDYNWDTVPPFLVFDIWSHNTNEFLPLSTAKEITARLGLQFVPVLETLSADTFKDLYTTQAKQKLALVQQEAASVATALSTYTPQRQPTPPSGSFTPEFPYPIPSSQYRDGDAEGVVFKNYDTQTFAKHISEDFKEVNNLRWGFSQRDPETGEGLKKTDYTKYLVAKYVTDTRIEKQLRKLVMDTGTLGMELTPDLIDAVYEDVWAEHGDTIIYSGNTIDTDRFLDLVADRCRYRLRAIIENRTLIADMDDSIDNEQYLDLMAIGKN